MVAISSDNFLARRHNRYGTVQQGVVPCRGTVRSTQRVGRFWRCRELKEEAMSQARMSGSRSRYRLDVQRLISTGSRPQHTLTLSRVHVSFASNAVPIPF